MATIERLTVWAALAALVALGVSTACAQASPEPPFVASSSSARQARHFWTGARMRRAGPLSLDVTQSAVGRVRRSDVDVARSEPHRYPPRAPSPRAGASSAAEAVVDPTLPGISQNGAIFVVLGFGGVARCSGTSVNAPNLSLVFTAGHCVRSYRHWLDRKWVFVPGYRHGERPFGVFTARWLGTTPQWLAGGNENFDVGVAVVSRNERGERLAEAVGGDGIAWGLSPNQVFDIYGYPVAEPFDGATLQHCAQTPYEGHDFFSFLWPGPLNLAVDCDVTGGSSGGGWVVSGGLLNGVTTYGYRDDPATDFGPYFGREVGKLFTAAAAIK